MRDGIENRDFADPESRIDLPPLVPISLERTPTMCILKAERFASSLDSEDFATASGLLDDRCVYYFGGECITGKDRVISTYRDNTPRAGKVFKRIIYSHSLEQIGHREFLIIYIDAIKHRGKSFVHKCKQKIAFNRFDKIDLIIHHDMPGENDKLEMYLHVMED